MYSSLLSLVLGMKWQLTFLVQFVDTRKYNTNLVLKELFIKYLLKALKRNRPSKSRQKLRHSHLKKS